MLPTPSELRAYYTGALACLRFVEGRRPTARRFGTEADARWGTFRGDLTTADRVDLLLRDADADWVGAFGARTVFGEVPVAEEDAFGPGWPSLEPVDAEEVWRSALAGRAPGDVAALSRVWANAWGLALAPSSLAPIVTLDRFVVAGPSAIAALLLAFVGREDLAWTEQVTVVATPPAHRQLALFSTAVLGTPTPTRLVTHSHPGELVGRAVVSNDAAPADAETAARSVS